MKAFSAFATLATFVVAVQSVPCTPEQLSGDFNSFRLPGGGGEYFSGTRQVVSWDNPVGSPVTSINSVTVLNATEIASPTNVWGVPVTIPSSSADQSGAIRVTLPELDEGRYVFGVQVVSGNEQCTVYSAPFEIISEDDEDDDNGNDDGNNGNDDVQNRCDFGDSRCARQSSGIRTCVQTSLGRRFGLFQSCLGGQTCEQAGNNAYCTLSSGGNMGDRCEIGESRCARNNTGYRTCTETPMGRRFRRFQTCPGGQTCRQGEISATCSLGSGNVVGPGQQCYILADYTCIGDSFIVCQTDANGGLVWSASTPCGAGQTCRIVEDNLNCVAK